MCNLASYTSNGRIRELILFDKESYAISKDTSYEEKLNSVLDYYLPFVENLNNGKGVSVKLFVLFDVMEPEVWRRTEAAGGTLTLLPVNSIVSGANIPTPWTQDVIHILHGEQKGEVVIRVDSDRVSQELFDVLRNEIPGNWELADCSKLPAGGNCLRIEDAGTEICIVNKDPNETTPIIFSKTGMAEQLKVPPSNYHLLELGALDEGYCSPVFKRLVYHADQYITPVGRLADDSRYLFFVPEILPAKTVPTEKSGGIPCLVTLGKQLADIKEVFEGIVGPVKCETLPLFVLDFEKDPFGLCYNNCLVEHYLLDGNRHTIIYFPDYREPVRKQLERARMDGRVMKGIDAIVKYAGIMDGLADLSPGAHKGLNVLNDYFAWQDEPAKHSFPGAMLPAENLAGVAAVEKKSVSAKVNKTKEMNLLSEYFTEKAILNSFDLLGNVIELTEAAIEKVQNDLQDRLAHLGIQSHFISLDFRNDAERLGGLHCRLKVIYRDCEL